MPAKKTVAIVGSHNDTRDAAPWDRRWVDIWVFNESVSLGWTKRADAVFQMHHEAVWRNPLNRNDGKYPEWLAAPHPYPVYMLEQYPDVPACVRYPFEQVVTYMPPIYRGRQREELIDFFSTCSVAYALALAIAQGYEVIELYGVEMASDTEYTYQRDSVFYWLGVAGGRGIELIVHPESGFFKQPLYGYEGGVSLQKDDFVQRTEKLAKHIEVAREKLDQVQDKVVALMERVSRKEHVSEKDAKAFHAAIRAQAQAVLDFTSLIGAHAEAERYAHKADVMDSVGGKHLFARQEFEIIASQTNQAQENQRARMQVAGGAADALYRQMQAMTAKGEATDDLAQRYLAAHEQYLSEVAGMGKLTGIVNENLEYIGKVDKLIKAAGGEKSREALEAYALNGHVEVPIVA